MALVVGSKICTSIQVVLALRIFRGIIYGCNLKLSGTNFL